MTRLSQVLILVICGYLFLQSVPPSQLYLPFWSKNTRGEEEKDGGLVRGTDVNVPRSVHKDFSVRKNEVFPTASFVLDLLWVVFGSIKLFPKICDLFLGNQILFVFWIHFSWLCGQQNHFIHFSLIHKPFIGDREV